MAALVTVAAAVLAERDLAPAKFSTAAGEEDVFRCGAGGMDGAGGGTGADPASRGRTTEFAMFMHAPRHPWLRPADQRRPWLRRRAPNLAQPYGVAPPPWSRPPASPALASRRPAR